MKQPTLNDLAHQQSATQIMRNLRFQKFPNLMPSEKRLCLTRIRFETGGKIGVAPEKGGGGCSHKISISVGWKLCDFWVGIYWCSAWNDRTWYLCILPCLPIRVHWVKTYGGVFP